MSLGYPDNIFPSELTVPLGYPGNGSRSMHNIQRVNGIVVVIGDRLGEKTLSVFFYGRWKAWQVT